VALLGTSLVFTPEVSGRALFPHFIFFLFCFRLFLGAELDPGHRRSRSAIIESRTGPRSAQSTQDGSPECGRNAGSEVGIEIHRVIEAALGLSTTKHRKIARKVVWRVSSRRRTKPLRSQSPRRNSAMICRKGEITTGREWLHHLALPAERVRCARRYFAMPVSSD
jgi:hypothetical protein